MTSDATPNSADDLARAPQFAGAPTAALLLIGNELLSGKIVDLNGPVVVKGLQTLGVDLRAVEVVPDEVPVIAEAIRRQRTRVDSIITSGGVGPTHDDVTMRAVAAAFDSTLSRHPEFERLLVDFFGRRANEHILRMADLPKGARLLGGGAPVPVVAVENVHIFPGEPNLFRTKFEAVASEFARGTACPFTVRRIFSRCEEGEIAGMMTSIQAAHPQVRIGSYPRYEESHWWTQITVDGRDAALVDQVLSELRGNIGDDRIIRIE